MNIKNKTDFTEIRCLETFEGDLLTHVKDEETQKEYVWMWVDVIDKNNTPWTQKAVMTETSQERVDKYMNKEITLSQLMSQNTDCLLVTEHGQDITAVESKKYLELPVLYQVKAGTYHNEELRPENY